MAFKRIVWMVLDSVGIGAMPDAGAYGDQGSDTLGNVARKRKLELPNLCRLGLANIKCLAGLPRSESPAGAYGKCRLASPGKDTTTGHWEMAGIILDKPFPLYPYGFPPDVIALFEGKIGRKVLGNKPASGTEIIKELGEEHMHTGSPIVYTSADSVFQIAAHEQIIPLAELYHDYAVPPPPGMLLDRLAAKNVPVYSIGKISDIFLGRGITHSVKTKDNADGMRQTIDAMKAQIDGVIFVNLVDFDQQFGHRNDVEGYARALEAVDRWLPTLELQQNDMLIFTADHGCDPTTPSTDHSREYTPLLVYGPRVHPACNLGTRATLADIGQSVAHNFGTELAVGTSFLEEIQL
jgi:phosphopentomutase